MALCLIESQGRWKERPVPHSQAVQLLRSSSHQAGDTGVWHLPCGQRRLLR